MITIKRVITHRLRFGYHPDAFYFSYQNFQSLFKSNDVINWEF